jgi:hypothetical protein
MAGNEFARAYSYCVDDDSFGKASSDDGKLSEIYEWKRCRKS